MLRARRTVSLVCLVSAVGIGSACGRHGASKRPGPTAGEAAVEQSPPPDAVAPDPVAELAAAPFPTDEPDLAPPDRSALAAVRAAVRDGRLYEAKRMLAALVRAYPEGEILLRQYNSVSAKLEEAKRPLREAMEGAELVHLLPPPSKRAFVGQAAVEPGAEVPVLVQVEVTKTLEEANAWLVNHDLHLPLYAIPSSNDVVFAPGMLSLSGAGALLAAYGQPRKPHPTPFLDATVPVWLPMHYGELALSSAIDSSPYTIAIYGGYVVAVVEKKHLVALFDISAYEHPEANVRTQEKVGTSKVITPEGSYEEDIVATVDSITLDLRFALARDGVLYVQHAGWGSPEQTKNQNAFITALELGSGYILWRSEPLVANSRDFMIVGGGIVTGYGYGRKSRQLFVLDRRTGEAVQQIPLARDPDYIVADGERIRVHAYSRDYVFEAKPRKGR